MGGFKNEHGTMLHLITHAGRHVSKSWIVKRQIEEEEKKEKEKFSEKKKRKRKRSNTITFRNVYDSIAYVATLYPHMLSAKDAWGRIPLHLACAIGACTLKQEDQSLVFQKTITNNNNNDDHQSSSSDSSTEHKLITLDVNESLFIPPTVPHYTSYTLAHLLVRLFPSTVTVQNNSLQFPIQVAASGGHTHLVQWLAQVNPSVVLESVLSPGTVSLVETSAWWPHSRLVHSKSSNGVLNKNYLGTNNASFLTSEIYKQGDLHELLTEQPTQQQSIQTGSDSCAVATHAVLEHQNSSTYTKGDSCGMKVYACIPDVLQDLQKWTVEIEKKGKKNGKNVRKFIVVIYFQFFHVHFLVKIYFFINLFLKIFSLLFYYHKTTYCLLQFANYFFFFIRCICH